MILESVSDADIKAVVKTLVREAKGGSVKAAQVLLDRVAGKVAEPEIAPDDAELHVLRCEARLESEERRARMGI